MKIILRLFLPLAISILSVESYLWDWYFQETQLCFDWHADGSGGGQCTAFSNPLCAKINDYTPVYRDYTHRRSGGCQTSWGILSPPNSPGWFKEVQICHRWLGFQYDCWDHRRGYGEVCAHVGSFTSFHRDSLSVKPGRCAINAKLWKLKVPSNAPAWMLNSSLCFKWVAYGNSVDCGRREVCAKANNWVTSVQNPSSKSKRLAGCQMSWRIRSTPKTCEEVV